MGIDRNTPRTKLQHTIKTVHIILKKNEAIEYTEKIFFRTQRRESSEVSRNNSARTNKLDKEESTRGETSTSRKPIDYNFNTRLDYIIITQYVYIIKNGFSIITKPALITQLMQHRTTSMRNIKQTVNINSFRTPLPAFCSKTNEGTELNRYHGTSQQTMSYPNNQKRASPEGKSTHKDEDSQGSPSKKSRLVKIITITMTRIEKYRNTDTFTIITYKSQ